MYKFAVLNQFIYKPFKYIFMETKIFNGKEFLVGVIYSYNNFTFTIHEVKNGRFFVYTLTDTATGKERQYTSDSYGLKKRIGFTSTPAAQKDPETVITVEETQTTPAATQTGTQNIDVAAALNALQSVFGGGKDEELRAAVAELSQRVTSLESMPARKIEITTAKGTHTITGLQHGQFEKILKCAALPLSAKCMPYLHGPSGTGKTHTAKAVADALGLDFFCISAIQDILQFEGFVSPITGAYQRTAFRDAYENGGLALLDEIDGSIPDILVKLNAAFGNGYYAFPDKVVYAHKDFRVIAAGNTCGKGASAKYTGRFPIDEATLNRFAVIPFGYDKDVENALSNGNTAAVDIVRGLRAAVDRLGLPFDYGYRDIERISHLSEMFSAAEVIEIAVVRGRTADEMRNITNNIPAEYRQNALYLAMAEMFK